MRKGPGEYRGYKETRMKQGEEENRQKDAMTEILFYHSLDIYR